MKTISANGCSRPDRYANPSMDAKGKTAFSSDSKLAELILTQNGMNLKRACSSSAIHALTGVSRRINAFIITAVPPKMIPPDAIALASLVPCVQAAMLRRNGCFAVLLVGK